MNAAGIHDANDVCTLEELDSESFLEAAGRLETSMNLLDLAVPKPCGKLLEASRSVRETLRPRSFFYEQAGMELRLTNVNTKDGLHSCPLSWERRFVPIALIHSSSSP